MPFEQYGVQLALIEKVFGRAWLEARVGNHPVRRAWRRRYAIQRLMDSYQIDLTPIDEVTFTDDVASELRRASMLPGFAPEVTDRLKDEAGFPATLYECRIASHLARAGHRVEFLPQVDASVERRPDLAIAKDGKTLLVECKLKDRVKLEPPPAHEEASWRSRIESLLGSFAERSLNICVLVLGEIDSALFDRILEEASRLVESGGTNTGYPDQGFLILFMAPVEIPDVPVAGFRRDESEGGLNPTVSAYVADATPAADGMILVRHLRSLRIFALIAHSVDQLRSTFSNFNGKIQPGQPGQPGQQGMLYVGLDLPTDSLALTRLCIRLAGSALMKIAWGRGKNRRIRGIVLVVGPVYAPKVAQGFLFRKAGHIYGSFVDNKGVDYEPHDVVEEIFATWPS